MILTKRYTASLFDENHRRAFNIGAASLMGDIGGAQATRPEPEEMKMKQDENDKIKVCKVCKNAEICQTKFGPTGYAMYVCYQCKVAGRLEIVETEYIKEEDYTTESAFIRLKQLDNALEEIARLERRIARYKRAEEARDEMLRASLQPTQEQIIETDTATAASIYADFGRDEWPSPV